MTTSDKSKSGKLTTGEMVVFSVLGAIMFCSKLLMEWAPNIHLLGVFIIVFTVVYRKKALIPIYIFVFLCGIYGGFSPWWIPYLYIWTVLWGVTMLLPVKMAGRVAVVVYMFVCGLHGLFFGILYAPAQAIIYSMSFQAVTSWVIAGIPFDCMHALGNFAAGILAVPLIRVLRMFKTKQSF
ncbi:MAG: hypothetical protein Q4B04_04285 [bacterium]|nr:hypothetical protein [bacterium]